VARPDEQRNVIAPRDERLVEKAHCLARRGASSLRKILETKIFSSRDSEPMRPCGAPVVRGEVEL
jgi:hypothetical protein